MTKKNVKLQQLFRRLRAAFTVSSRRRSKRSSKYGSDVLQSSLMRTIIPDSSTEKYLALLPQVTPHDGSVIDSSITVITDLPVSNTSHPIPSHPIHNLPVELLELILFHCIPQARTTHLTAYKRGPCSPIWVNVTYVCHFWRQVALRYPHLWTHITTDLSLQWIIAFLDRSRSAPLVVEVDTGRITLGVYETHLSAHTFRMRELYLGSQSFTGGDPGYLDSLRSPAPLLETLIIDMGPCGHVKWSLFSDSTPRLCRLWLHHSINAPSGGLLLHNLRYLKLESSLSMLEETFALLQRVPLLEILRINLYGGRRGLAQQTLPTLIRLPNLSLLEVSCSDEYDAFIGLFERLQIPPTVHFKLSFHIYSFSPLHVSNDQLVHIFNMIGIHTRTVGEAMNSLMYLQIFVQPTSFHLEAKPNPRPTCCNCSSPCEHVKSNSLPVGNGHSMGRRAPLSSVHALHLCLEHFMSCDSALLQGYRTHGRDIHKWRSILCLMPEILILKVSYDAIPGVLRALTPNANAGDVSNPPVYAKLTELVIANSVIRCLDGIDSDIDDLQLRSVALGSLETFLSKRKEAGLALDVLIFSQCKCVGGSVKSLKRYVKRLTWKGYGGFDLTDS